MQNGRVEIVHVHGIFDCSHAELIGGPVGEPALHASTGEEHREAGVMMVAPGLVLLLILRVRRPAELPAPDDQRILEHAALLEIGDECAGGPVAIRTERLVPLVVVRMRIPRLIVRLLV